MNAQLYEEMNLHVGAEETAQVIEDALKLIERGGANIPLGVRFIQEAVSGRKARAEITRELRKNMDLMNKLTTTQVRTAKELKSMATAEQVFSLVETFYRVVVETLEKHLDDPVVRERITIDIANAIRLTGRAGVR